MAKLDSISLTSSNLIALWQLIFLTKKHNMISVRSAIEITFSSGLLGGGLPADQGLKLGQFCKLLEIDKEQILLPTQSCKDELLNLCDSEEPNILVVRGILFRFVSFKNFDWLLFFNDDPEVFKIGIPDEWIELLDQADLFDFNNPEVRDWWSKIFNKFQTYKEGQKIEVGKVAEKLTFEYEKNRINLDGLDNGHYFIKWASQLNDKYGYDILSIRGRKLLFDFTEKGQIKIEVKSSVLVDENEFRFFITKNEWNVAFENLDSYYFYCWTSTNKERETANGPYIIPAEIFKDHIPIDNSTICTWSECRLIVNLNDVAI